MCCSKWCLGGGEECPVILSSAKRCSDLGEAGMAIIICELISVRRPDGRNNACFVAKANANSL